MLNGKINKIEKLQRQIEAFGEFPKEVKDKIYYKLRLDWNYYSNSIEGGTLTREETRSVMSGVLNLKNKPYKDFREMEGHNRVVIDLFKMSQGGMRLSEARVKDFHQQIMFDEDPEKGEQIGEWKKHNNEVINYRKEKITFANANEVSDLMHDLLNRLNAYLDRFYGNNGEIAPHPVEIAADFHVDFLTIHPFYDGNGRMARILSNLILIACGYPIFVIRKEDKETYNQLLSDIQAYGGDRNQFIDFIGERVRSTQEMILKALNGGDIEDDDDLDKEIELLRRKQHKTPEPIKKSKETITHVLNHVYLPILKEVDKLGRKFSALFDSVEWNYYHDPRSVQGYVQGNLKGITKKANEVIAKDNYDIYELKFNLYLLKYLDDNEFSAELAVRMNFHEENFDIEILSGIPLESGAVITLFKSIMEAISEDNLSVSDGESFQLLEGPYDLELTDGEIKEYSQRIGKALLNFIKRKTEKKS